MFRSASISTAAVVGAALLSAPAIADEDPPEFSFWDDATISFVWENDIYGGSDDNYTNGVQFSIMSPLGRDLPLTRRLRRILPDYLDNARQYRTGFGFGQTMFTPEDISLPVPNPADRPYAGYLYANFTLVAEQDDRTIDTAQLQVGIVGPASGAEWVQTNWHRLLDAQDPKGWPHQLNNELGVVLRLERALHTRPHNWGPLEVEADFNFGGALGNVETSASVGAGVRIGERFTGDYGPPRIRPALGGATFFDDSEGVGWYVFAGVNVRGVARNLFLDGNTFASSASVDDRHLFVGDFQSGVAVTAGRVRLSFTYVYRTEEFSFQEEGARFGAASISYRF